MGEVLKLRSSEGCSERRPCRSVAVAVGELREPVSATGGEP
jgi:hypothetical protein